MIEDEENKSLDENIFNNQSKEGAQSHHQVQETQSKSSRKQAMIEESKEENEIQKININRVNEMDIKVSRFDKGPANQRIDQRMALFKSN
mgnify:CR=1 FL=1